MHPLVRSTQAGCNRSQYGQFGLDFAQVVVRLEKSSLLSIMNTIRTPLYLDTAASTPVDKTVAEQMLAVMLGGGLANPSSTHIPGQISADLVSQARSAIAAEYSTLSRSSLLLCYAVPLSMVIGCFLGYRE